MSWICLVGGSAEQAVRAVQECGFEAGIIADYRSLGKAFLQKSSAVFPARIEDVDSVRHALERMMQCLGKPAAIISFSEKGLLPAAQLSIEYQLPTNAVEVVLSTRDKALMRKKLESDLVLALPFIQGDAHRIYQSLLEQLSEGSWIIKPVMGAGSQSVQRVKNRLELDNWQNTYQHVQTDWIAEPYVMGSEFSVEAVSIQGKHVILGITEKETTGSPAYIETGHVFPAPLSTEAEMAIHEVVDRFLSVMGVQMGATHTEVKIDLIRGPVIIETHTRVGGDCITELVEQAIGLNQYLLAVQSIVGQEVSLTRKDGLPNQGAAIQFFQAQEGCLSSIAYQPIAKQTSAVRWHFEIAVGQPVPKMVDSLSRAGYVICWGKSAEEARSNAKTMCEAFSLQVQPLEISASQARIGIEPARSLLKNP